jgi:hypothetical protein
LFGPAAAAAAVVVVEPVEPAELAAAVAAVDIDTWPLLLAEPGLVVVGLRIH